MAGLSALLGTRRKLPCPGTPLPKAEAATEAGAEIRTRSPWWKGCPLRRRGMGKGGALRCGACGACASATAIFHFSGLLSLSSTSVAEQKKFRKILQNVAAFLQQNAVSALIMGGSFFGYKAAACGGGRSAVTAPAGQGGGVDPAFVNKL